MVSLASNSDGIGLWSKMDKLCLVFSLCNLIGRRFDSFRIWLIRQYRVICLEHITAALITKS